MFDINLKMCLKYEMFYYNYYSYYNILYYYILKYMYYILLLQHLILKFIFCKIITFDT